MFKPDVNYGAEAEGWWPSPAAPAATNTGDDELWLLNFNTVWNAVILTRPLSNIYIKESAEIEEKHILNDRISRGPLWSGN